jgi:hypothetical protein
MSYGLSLSIPGTGRLVCMYPPRSSGTRPGPVWLPVSTTAHAFAISVSLGVTRVEAGGGDVEGKDREKESDQEMEKDKEKETDKEKGKDKKKDMQKENKYLLQMRGLKPWRL